METLRSLFGTPSVPWWVVTLLALFPVVIWCALFWYNDSKPEPRRLLVKTGLAGVATTLVLVVMMYVALKYPNLALDRLIGRVIHVQWLAVMLYFLVVAIIEEYVKHIGMIVIIERHRKEFDQIVDGVVYAVAAAMGFAFIENIFYLSDASRSLIVGVFIARSIGATLGHAVFSGTFGYFYGRATFAKQVLTMRRSTLASFHRALPTGILLHVIRTHLLPRRGIMDRAHSRGELLAEGFWAAVLLHLLYNILVASTTFLPWNLSLLVAPFLMLALGHMLWRMSLDKNQRVRRVVVNLATLPEWLIPTVRARKIRRALRLTQGL